MRWDRGHRSKDVIDRRGQGGARGPGLGGMMMLAQFLPRLGLPGFLALLVGLVLYATFSGARFLTDGPSTARLEQGPVDDPAAFVSFVLDDVQTSWGSAFAERGGQYAPAELVLFTDATQSSCGVGTAEVGPFYCPRDARVYIDLAFYRELAQRYGARGDFAQAYVIAHEIGHHVQFQLGDSGDTSNAASVRRELQADCLAGVWARSAEERGLVEPGDLEEGLGAAAAVGDDRLQRAATGTVTPETWTHGSAADRAAWFRRGYDGGRLEACADAAPSG